MFKLQPNPTFKHKVAIHVPGVAKPAEIEVEFKHLTRDELAEYFKGLPERKDDESLPEIVAGWSGVDVPYSPDALRTLLNNYVTAGRALFDAFLEGNAQAREKN